MKLNFALAVLNAVLLATAFYIAINEYKLYSLKKRVFAVNLKDSLISLTSKAIKKESAQRLREKLRKAGNPLGLTPETFIIAKILLVIFAIFYTQVVSMELTQKIAFIGFAFYAPDLYVHFSQQDRETNY